MELREVTDAAGWDLAVADHEFGHPLQCWGWGEVKRGAGWRAHRYAVFDDGAFRAGAQVLTRPFRGLPVSMLYAPRGPVVAPGDAEALGVLARGIRRHARADHAIFWKVDPAWPAGTTNALVEVGFTRSRDAVQVTDTYTIDLRQSEDEILAGMRSKTRQYIRKAEREETQIVRDSTGEHLAECYAVYQETARRAGFGLHAKAYYDNLFSQYPTERQFLYVALRHGAPLSFLWLVCAGRQAVEFYGGVADAGQDFKSNYLLKWHAIREMKSAGYETYDLNGRLNEGIAQFKQGFGPAESSWVGPYDAVYRRLLYSGWSVSLPLARRVVRRAE